MTHYSFTVSEHIFRVYFMSKHYAVKKSCCFPLEFLFMQHLWLRWESKAELYQVFFYQRLFDNMAKGDEAIAVMSTQWQSLE